MKFCCFLSLSLFIFPVFAQRNRQDSLNLLKVEEVKNMVTEKLSGTVTQKDVLDFATYIMNSKSTTPRFQYLAWLNLDLTEEDLDPAKPVDVAFIDKSFTQLKKK